MNASTDESSPGTTAPPPAPAAPPAGVRSGLGIALIVAASLLLLSIFLPWSSWAIDLEGTVKATSRTDFGDESTAGGIMVLAGMVALALAFMVRAVSRRFAGYAALPGCLALIALAQHALLLHTEHDYDRSSLKWGYWIAVAAAVAVVGLSLAIMRRKPDAGHDQS